MQAGDFDVMGYLWESQDHTDDGEHVVYTDADVEMLWHLGFVDTVQVPMATWKAAFAPHHQPDGNYRLAHADFLALDRHRYKGEIYAPFDFRRINEGLYTDEGLQEMLDDSVAPSCSLAPGDLQARVNALKAQYREPNGLIRMGAPAKQEIGRWLEEHPSPLRRMEILFVAMLAAEAEDWLAGNSAQAAMTPQQIARVEASSFSLLPSTQSEASAKGLHTLTQANPSATPPTPPDKGTPLGQLRRSRRGIKS